MTVGPDDEAARDAATDSVTFAFADARGGALRAGPARPRPRARTAGTALAVLFAGREPVAALRPRRPCRRRTARPGRRSSWPGVRHAIEQPLTRWRAASRRRGGDGFALEFLRHRRSRRAAATATRSRGSAAWPATTSRAACAGRSASAAASAASTAWASAATRGARPDWERIELARSVAAWTDAGASAALAAVRPAGARHHADEAVWAALWEPEGLLPLDEARLSTTYDARRPHAPRRARAVAGARTAATAGPAAAPARCSAAPRSTSASCGWTARSSAGTSRAATASAATT